LTIEKLLERNHPGPTHHTTLPQTQHYVLIHPNGNLKTLHSSSALD